MYHPIQFEMEAKLHHAELLKVAAQARAARIAQGDTHPRTAAPWWALALSLGVLAASLVMLAGVL